MRLHKKWAVRLIVLVIFLWVFIPKVPSYSVAIKANWGISLPYKALCTEVYAKDSGPSFQGDGIRYHVFEYKYEDYIDLMFAWSQAEHETGYFASVSAAAESWLDEIEVPQEQRPDYAACGSWHMEKDGGDTILFFWDSQRNRIYTVESFF